MFQGLQRIKGAIDSRIAEEQARQKAATGTPSGPRNSSTARRSTSRTDSPSGKSRRPKPKDDSQAPIRGPDPSEFESAFVLEDETDEPSRVGTPAIVEEEPGMMSGTAPADEEGTGGESNEKGAEKSADAASKPQDLPLEVRSKLRRAEKLESRYGELLKSYRIAHARAILIEPFEKTLKEHTPLATISDPGALVEYLNQVNLKGDMVMDELKRVSVDRDDYKKKFEEAEKQSSTARAELASLKDASEVADETGEKTDLNSVGTPSASVKSPVSSVLGGIFSPKQQPTSTDNQDVVEEFFSYEDEIPQLQMEVKQKTAEIEELKSKVSQLQENLETAQESSSGLVENLERVTRELNGAKEAAAEGESRQAKIDMQSAEMQVLVQKIKTNEEQISTLQVALSKQKAEADQRIEALEADISERKLSLSRELQSHDEARRKAENSAETVKAQVTLLESLKVADAARIVELQSEITALTAKAAATSSREVEETGSKVDIEPDTPSTPATATSTTGGAKKKNKKKKKGGNAANSNPKEELTVPTTGVSETSKVFAAGIETEVMKLKEDLADRDAQILKLQSKRKTEEELREELENMQDNFLSIGQEHVESQEKIKELKSEKKVLEEKIAQLEQQIVSFQTQSKDSAKAGAELKTLAVEYEDLKSKSATLQTDLGAAQQLAASRYRDLTDLREVLQKAQPELKSLRTDNATLKATKEELATRTSELRRLEARERDLKSDVAAFKKQATDRDGETKTLNEKITQETNGRLKAEDQLRIANRDLRRSEAEKIQLAASGEKNASELEKIQVESGKLRAKVKELEVQVTNLSSESKSLREEVDLRGSQYTSAQGLLGSMRDQAGEMAMQLKEAKEQSESLEEELGEVQRLLSERTREGETMRRLLADVDDRADAKVREMRERMEAAIEERDRAEDEASTNSRRRAREVDELKTKIRDFERDLKRAIDDRDELAQSEKEWKRKRSELESSSGHAAKEANDIRSAMGELRSALDGSEKQARDAEKQRSDLRRMLDEANQRYEKLQKEFKSLQVKQNRLVDAPSSRSSIDSGRAGTPPTNGVAGGKMDYVYLKTILLQFLEQKDKKRQADLVKTVLGQLLHFDKKDQEKWIAAISAK